MFDLLKPIYENQDNYKIIDNPDAAEPDLVAIYFLSVGWCSPKNVHTRIAEDYYEFRRNQVKRAGRHIYVRELALASYAIGINPQINTIDKLLILLQEKTAGYKKIVTMGSSGGGFMAMISGVYLHAQYIISLSGPIDLLPFSKY